MCVCDSGLEEGIQFLELLQLLVLAFEECNDYNGFWDLTWLLSGGGSKDSQLFRQQCCKVIYTSKGPCR